MSVCFICESTLEEDGKKTTVVKEKGLQSLYQSSLKRKDGKNKILASLNSVNVHEACRKSYNNERMIAAHLRRLEACTSQVHTRSKVDGFNFKTHCLLCSKEIKFEFLAKYPNDEKEKVYCISKMHTRKSILETAHKRGDEWGSAVIKRISNISDLVAANAQYHNKCMKKFFSTVRRSTGKRNGPNSDEIEKAMQYIYDYIDDNSDECQFSLTDLMNKIRGSYCPHIQTVKAHLLRKYGDGIIIAISPNKAPIVCLRGSEIKILSDSWYENRKSSVEEERDRVVDAAGAIIAEDLCSMVYNTEVYPPSDNFFLDVKSCIPESLLRLLEIVIAKTKKPETKDKWIKKCIAIAHCIISAARPKSFISPLLVGLAAFVHRKYASRGLINVLYSLGFCASYSEAVRLEISAIQHPQVEIKSGGFSQFTFDNADFNTNTLDGHGTFHAMGGIQCITPSSSVTPAQQIERLEKVPTADVVGKIGMIDLQMYDRGNSTDLSCVKVQDLDTIKALPTTSTTISPASLLWMYGKWKSTDFPGWSGFMEQVASHLAFQQTRVVCLPFVNAPPSHYDTVFTVLSYASANSKSLNQHTCFVTFDQPLYIKGREIATTLDNVEVRLGGFHLLMSFMGAVGLIMAGSGLRELFGTIFANNSLDKIMDGHAYARALRAHLLAQFAMATLIFESLGLTTEHINNLNQLLFPNFNGSQVLSASKEPCVQDLSVAFENQLQQFMERGPTAKLWVQYFNMVTLIRCFIEAERMGNWELHLTTVRKMLPFFHSSGHFLYAKACHIYLQDMTTLKERMLPDEYEKFTSQGFFTIRRTDKFWSGTWTDMTIEQSLMKLMKSRGGVTHGRGVSESVLAMWTLGMVATQNICEEVERFCNVSFTTSEQHVELRTSRINRDNRDVNKLISWFQQHCPFPEKTYLMSLSTGLVGDDRINCHNAEEIGEVGVAKIVGKDFASITFKRKDRVNPLEVMTSSIPVEGESVLVNPTSLFQRISIVKQSDEELENFLSYELAPYPLSLFNENGMRKGTKSTLYKAFKESDQSLDLKNSIVVVDGGFLLHRVVWGKGMSFSSICNSYVNYVLANYGSTATVVFDGYPEVSIVRGTKQYERNRRSRKHASTTLDISDNLVPSISQENFLANPTNKRRLIEMLLDKFKSALVSCKQAEEDADTMIVKTAVDLTSQHDSVVVVGEDIDLLVLMIASSCSSKLHFVKPGKGKASHQIYTCGSALTNSMIAENILFIHAFSGCDTTSAPFGQGKIKFIKTLTKNPHLLDVVSIFKSQDATPSMVDTGGELFLLQLYGCKDATKTTLNEWRYKCFIKSALTTKSNIASLPPSKEAAKQHSYRSYYQIQQWLGVMKDARDWGWKKGPSGLIPVTTVQPPAPDSVLKLISCKCKTGCRGACGCRKAGLICSVLCVNCSGACENRCQQETNDEDLDECDIFQEMMDEDLDQLQEAGCTPLSNAEEIEIPLEQNKQDEEEFHDSKNYETPNSSKRRRFE